MPIPAILLRLLLILTLFANGVGTAYASAMPGAPAVVAKTAATQPGGQGEACADHHQGGASIDEGAQAAVTSPTHGEHSTSDCCESSVCRCACLHACASLMTAQIHVPTIIARHPGVKPMALGHPAPALPHLIRPPIG